MENKLQQAKDTIAKKYGYKSFEQFDDKSTFGYNHDTPKIIDEIALEYHRLMSEWISVDEIDKLPTDSSSWYFVRRNNDIFVTAHFYAFGLWYGYGNGSLFTENITHFIPVENTLPQPPKK